MSGTQRSRFLDMDTLRDRFDRVFSDLVSSGGETEGRDRMPVDVHEAGDTITVKASMPGVKPGDVAVEIRGDVLTIRGENYEERDEKTGTWHIVERRVGKSERTITLPAPVDEASGNATYEDGILSIIFKKTMEKPGKRIEVKSAPTVMP